MTINDTEIINAILNGQDNKAVKALYKNVLPNIKKFVYASGGSSDDALDLFHDALIVFFKLVLEKKFDFEKYKIYGFVYTTSKNLWINQIKKKGSHYRWLDSQQLGENFEPSVLDHWVNLEKVNMIQNLMQSLGQKCIQILNMFLHQNLSYKEIAVLLNLDSESAAKVQAYRCRKELADKITKNKTIGEILKN